MSLEAWGDGGWIDEISPRDWSRIVERAQEKAMEADETGDDPPLELPAAASYMDIDVEDVSTKDTLEGWDLRCSYGGRSVVVFVHTDILLPFEPDW